MGKQKSTKPQKYVQQSDDNHMNFFIDENESDNIEDSQYSLKQSVTENNSGSLWIKKEKSTYVPEVKVKEENNHSTPKQSSAKDFWNTHFPLSGVGVNSNNNKFDFSSFKTEPPHSLDFYRENNSRVLVAVKETL